MCWEATGFEWGTGYQAVPVWHPSLCNLLFYVYTPVTGYVYVWERCPWVGHHPQRSSYIALEPRTPGQQRLRPICHFSPPPSSCCPQLCPFIQGARAILVDLPCLWNPPDSPNRPQLLSPPSIFPQHPPPAGVDLWWWGGYREWRDSGVNVLSRGLLSSQATLQGPLKKRWSSGSSSCCHAAGPKPCPQSVKASASPVLPGVGPVCVWGVRSVRVRVGVTNLAEVGWALTDEGAWLPRECVGVVSVEAGPECRWPSGSVKWAGSGFGGVVSVTGWGVSDPVSVAMVAEVGPGGCEGLCMGLLSGRPPRPWACFGLWEVGHQCLD